jgi:hypothetical protein
MERSPTPLNLKVPERAIFSGGMSQRRRAQAHLTVPLKQPDKKQD